MVNSSLNVKKMQKLLFVSIKTIQLMKTMNSMNTMESMKTMRSMTTMKSMKPD